MKGKIILGVGVILLVVTCIAHFLVFRSHIAATSRYMELDRTGCINKTALKAYGEGRFRADDGQEVVDWITQPALDTAKMVVMVLAVTAIINMAMGVALIRRQDN